MGNETFYEDGLRIVEVVKIIELWIVVLVLLAASLFNIHNLWMSEPKKSIL